MVETSFISNVKEGFSEEHLNLFSDVLSYSPVKTELAESFYLLLGKLIVSKGIPYIIYISDTHQCSEAFSKSLKNLVKGLEAADWGQVKLLVEQRESEILDSGVDLISWLNRKFSNRMFHQPKLERIPPNALKVELSNLIHSHNKAHVIDMLIDKANGSPFMLNEILHTLVDENVFSVVNFVHDGRGTQPYFRIQNPEIFQSILASMASDDVEVVKQRIANFHQKLLDSDDKLGCFLLGIMAIVDGEVTTRFLMSLIHEYNDAHIESHLAAFRAEGLISLDGDSYSFAHESKRDASYEWVLTHSEFKPWLHRQLNQSIISIRFDEILAIAALWSFTGDYEKSFERLDAALQVANGDFYRNFLCRWKINEVFLKVSVKNKLKEYLSNLHALLWNGQYILSVKTRIDLVDHATSILDASSKVLNIEMADYNEFEFHHYSFWLNTHSYSVGRGLEHAFKSTEHCNSAHRLARTLNRLIILCSSLGLRRQGAYAAKLALELTREVSINDDPDLLSVNLIELAKLIGGKDKESYRYFTSLPSQQPGRTLRQEAHDNMTSVFASAYCGDHIRAEKILTATRSLLESQSMNNLYIQLLLASGILAMQQGNFPRAINEMEYGFDEASRQGYIQDSLVIGYNLLVAYSVTNSAKSSLSLYLDLLVKVAELTRDPISPSAILHHRQEVERLLVCLQEQAKNTNSVRVRDKTRLSVIECAIKGIEDCITAGITDSTLPPLILLLINCFQKMHDRDPNSYQSVSSFGIPSEYLSTALDFSQEFQGLSGHPDLYIVF